MRKLLIEKIEDYFYYLKDENNSYKLNIEFYIEKPEVNDYLIMHEDLLKETMLSLGPLSGKWGKKITSSKDKDLVILLKNDEQIYLKRYYG